MNDHDIFQLDSAAIAYPYFASADTAHSFTLEAKLDEEINPEALKSAVEALFDRFPSIFVRLKKQSRGYVLEHFRDVSAFVEKRVGSGVKPYDVKNRDALILISHHGNTVEVEFFHAVTDGNGGIVFFKSLLAEYLRNLGEDIPDTCGILSAKDLPTAGELEDSYKKNFRKHLGTAKRSEKFAFQPSLKGSSSNWHRSNICIDISELKSFAKKYDATVTQIAVSLYMYAFYKLREAQNGKKPITIAVPVNLRPTFDSDSLRNFSLFFLTKLPAEIVSLETIIKQVKLDFANGSDKALLQKMININVAQQEMTLFRCLPRFMKRIVLKAGFQLYGERLYSSTLSNIGVFTVPEEMKKHIRSFRGMLSPVPINRIHCMAYCYNDVFSVTFTSRLSDLTVEETIVRLLSQNAIKAELILDDQTQSVMP